MRRADPVDRTIGSDTNIALFTMATRCCHLAAGAVVVVLVANVLRSASLFYIESGLIEAPPQAHEAVAIVMFAIAAGTLAAMSQRLARVSHAH